MHNFYANEVEAEFRRQEWERAAATDRRAAQVSAVRRTVRLPQLPQVSLASLRSLIASQVAVDGALNPSCAPRPVEC